MFQKTKLSLAKGFMAAVAIIAPLAAGTFSPHPAQAMSGKEFDAARGAKAVEFVQSYALQIANDIAPQNPAVAKQIKDYFTKPDPDTHEVEGINAVDGLYAAVIKADLEKLKQDPNAKLLNENPKIIEKLVAMAIREELHANVHPVNGKFQLVSDSQSATAATTRPAATQPVVADAAPSP